MPGLPSKKYYFCLDLWKEGCWQSALGFVVLGLGRLWVYAYYTEEEDKPDTVPFKV